MSRHRARRHNKRIARKMTAHSGTSPGSITVDPDSPKPQIQVIAYGPDSYVEAEIDGFDDIKPFLDSWRVTWINVDGLGDADLLRAFGIGFNLHRLSMEDVTSLYQRPKIDVYDDHLFIIARMPNMPPGCAHLETEQLNIFVGENYVITFQDRPGDCLEGIRDRIRNKLGRVRLEGADYLSYYILDAVIDSYFPLLEEYSTALEDLEEQVIEQPCERVAGEILHVKRNILGLRRVSWPLREVLSVMLRESTPMIKDVTRTYLKDSYDHIIHILDLVEVERELVSGLLDVYMSSISNRMNDVMRVLTIISTVFIPLTFVVGVYGMNFDTQVSGWNMPELEWRYGYPVVMLLMFVLAFAMVVFFARKGWLRSLIATRPVKHDPEPSRRGSDKIR